MRRILTNGMIVKSFRCVPQLRLIYYANPKVGATNIKYSMWVAAEAKDGKRSPHIYAHRRDEGPFITNIFEHKLFGSDELRSFKSFSVVRNPFLRALSGYLNKVGAGSGAWRTFTTQFGIRPNVTREELSFVDFLRVLDSHPDELPNHHFGPQYLNLLWPFASPHFIGRLEHFEEVKTFLDEAGVPYREQKRRTTKTRESLDKYYTEEAERIVARKFASDFKIFGYSPSLSGLGQVTPMRSRGAKSDNVIDLLASRKSPPRKKFDEAARVHVKFESLNDKAKKLALIEEVFETEDNWERLGDYAQFVERMQRPALLGAIQTRIDRLRHAHRDRVERKDIFIACEEMRKPGEVDKAARRAVRAARHAKFEEKARQKERIVAGGVPN